MAKKKLRNTFLGILFILIIGLFLSCTKNQPNQADEVVIEQASLVTPILNIATFDADAGKYLDTEIAVSGIVDHVCKHSGKKLNLVTDGASVHVVSETRFDDALIGDKINLHGIVREMRIDEGYCLQMEEDNTSKHKEGETNDEAFVKKQEQIQVYRDSMAVAGVDHLSFYSLEFVSLEKQSE